VAAAEKEGKVVWYSSVDVKVAEGHRQGRSRRKYPKIDVEVERSGSERVFQRINQEYQSNIKNVDVVNSSDAVALPLLEAAEVARRAHARRRGRSSPPQYRDPEQHVLRLARDARLHGLQHQPGEGGDAPKSYADCPRSRNGRASS
jgi:iron(III) transport system substrate-binding protein